MNLSAEPPLEWLLLMFLRDREEDDISNLLKGWLVPGAWREAHL